MATTYKTPGVYVDEISKFPPSVAQVETAIPAFIGYTEFAIKNGKAIGNEPTKVKSMLEYEKYFGKGAEINISGLTATSVLDGAATVTITPAYYLYDSMQLFYANGGGDCYIVSIGGYSSSGNVVENDFKIGINKLELFDEPTLLLFPDAVKLDKGGSTPYSSLKNVQQEALKQCGDLMDRFAILDLLKDDVDGKLFRDAIGMSDLKFGAAYTSWIKASLDKKVTLRQLHSFNLKDFTNSDPALNAIVDKYTNLLSNIDAAKTKVQTAFASKTLTEKFESPATAADKINLLYHIPALIDSILATAGIDNDYKTFILTSIVPAIEQKIVQNVMICDTNAPTGLPNWTHITGAGSILTDLPFCNSLIVNGTVSFISDKIDLLLSGMNSLINNYEQTLTDNIPVYANLLKAIHSKATEMPPSGAIAGIYCKTDNERGVWKAPANISLSSVDGVTQQFTNSDLDAFNVDTNSGKSINVIRPITGKGVMVMGARTLAGNDNEWRYIPVRRLFNMVEESCKKSTFWAVFEPNDAVLSIKVKGMIENYLYGLWTQGALAGAKAEHAYYVKCGLNMTMTAQDILEGRLIVEIGMAAVRPAEFIILKFSHKLQVS